MTALQKFVERFADRVARAARAFGSDDVATLDQQQRIIVRVLITSDELDGGYVAEAPDFPGAFAQGETVHEALDAIAAAVGDIIVLRFEQQAVRAKPSCEREGEAAYDLALSV